MYNNPPQSEEASKAHLNIRIVNTKPEHAEALEHMQTLIYPMLSRDELFTAEKYLNQIKLFPEGQFVALADINGHEEIVGATTTFRIQFDFNHPQHRFVEIVADGWLTHHDPHGEWLYGASIEVLPEFRRMGICGRLYSARRDLIHRLNLRGEITGGMLPGYKDYKGSMTVDDFVQNVVNGTAYCPTLTTQLKNGFQVKGVLHDYVTDPDAQDCCSLLVRENRDYIPEHILPVRVRINPDTRFRMLIPRSA